MVKYCIQIVEETLASGAFSVEKPAGSGSRENIAAGSER
jgi:hypothetical protein